PTSHHKRPTSVQATRLPSRAKLGKFRLQSSFPADDISAMKVLRRSTSVEAFVERDIPPLPSPPRSCGIKDLGEGGISLGGAAHPPGFLLRHEQGRPTSPTSVPQGLRTPLAHRAAFIV